MKFALVENGVVTQVQPNNQEGFVEAPDSVCCGMLYDGETFSDPPPAPVAVPSWVSRRQGRLALLDNGKLEDVETIINGIQDPIQKQRAQIEYESDRWERNSEFLLAMWALLGGTEPELDALFIYADTLKGQNQ